MGFSTAKDVGMDADAAAGQLLQFLIGFYARHAAMRRLPLYLAGGWVPASPWAPRDWLPKWPPS
jgi:hypothetical protein